MHIWKKFYELINAKLEFLDLKNLVLDTNIIDVAGLLAEIWLFLLFGGHLGYISFSKGAKVA